MKKSFRYLGYVGVASMLSLGFAQDVDKVATLEAQLLEMQKMQELMMKNYQSLQTQLADIKQSQVKTQEQQVVLAEKQETIEVAQEELAVNQSLGLGGGAGEGWWTKTSVGGYGELHLNINDNSDDQVDFHRWVLFINHEYNDSVRMFSEFELEHSLAGESKPGEVELEQAYIEFDITGSSTGKAGLFLLPVGILNEHHEPNTFYGVERNNIEKRVIPTTWWESGLGYSQEFENGVGMDLTLHSGLSINNGSNSIRSGRAKSAEQSNPKLATTNRVRYQNGGLKLAATWQHQTDVNNDTTVGSPADLFTAHAIYQKGGFEFRALYAGWNIDDAAFEASGIDAMSGWYVEPSYKFNAPVGQLGVFTRFASNDSESEVDGRTDLSIGANYWIVPEVVFKADLTRTEVDNGSTTDSFNLGVGYQF